MSDVRERMEKDQRAERAARGRREVHWSARCKEEVVLRELHEEMQHRPRRPRH